MGFLKWSLQNSSVIMSEGMAPLLWELKIDSTNERTENYFQPAQNV